jgi:hypothetical protein
VGVAGAAHEAVRIRARARPTRRAVRLRDFRDELCIITLLQHSQRMVNILVYPLPHSGAS